MKIQSQKRKEDVVNDPQKSKYHIQGIIVINIVHFALFIYEMLFLRLFALNINLLFSLT